MAGGHRAEVGTDGTRADEDRDQQQDEPASLASLGTSGITSRASIAGVTTHSIVVHGMSCDHCANAGYELGG